MPPISKNFFKKENPCLGSFIIYNFREFYTTVGILKPDMSRFQMVDFVWFSNGVVVPTIQKPDIFSLDPFYISKNNV